MELSQSAQESGWQDYPSEIWEIRKPVTWLHDWAFWEWCAVQYANREPILELACGNGRITRQLALAGYCVVAVDVNPHFLNRAVGHLPETSRSQVDFILQDMIQLALGQTFSLALMTDWAFPAILTQDDQLAFLTRLADHLKPNGIFAFNTLFPTVRQLGLQPFGHGLEWMEPGRSYDAVSQIETKLSGGQTLRLRHTSLSEICLLARLCGFEIVEQFGGTDRRPLHGLSDDDLTLVMRKIA